MGTPSVAKTAPKDKAEPAAQTTTVPLSDVTFTVYRPPHFIAEDHPQAVTIAGKDVAVLLDWFVRTYPMANVNGFRDQEDIGFEVEALAEACNALADANWGERDANSVFYGLHRVLADLSCRLTACAAERGERRPTVTIGQPAAE